MPGCAGVPPPIAVAAVSSPPPFVTGPTRRSEAAATVADSPDRLQLRKASQEFEAILIAEWWKSATAGFKGLSDEDETGLQAFGEFGQQAMSLAIAQAGGLGIGRMMFERLSGSAGVPPAVPWPSRP